MRTLFSDAPLAYRPRNGGEYAARHVLADDIAPGQAGLRVHPR